MKPEGMSSMQDKCALTSNHIICFSNHGASNNILEVYPLPRVPNGDDTAPPLTRSHKCLHHHPIANAVLLTERHELLGDNVQSAHYTFVAAETVHMGPEMATGGLFFLDLELVSDLATTTWTYVEFGERCHGRGRYTDSITGSSLAGTSRLLGWTTVLGEPIAIAASEDGDGRKVVRCGHISDMDQQRPMAFDGIHGRMCLLASPAQIEVASFV
jgi:hypothetical protein